MLNHVFDTDKRKPRWTGCVLLLFLPLFVHVARGLPYVYGKYDGTHCQGILDSTWPCSKVEYYADALFLNGFAMYGLVQVYAVFFAILALSSGVIIVRNRIKRSQSIDE